MSGARLSDNWDSRRAGSWSGSWENWKKNDSWETNESREYGARRVSGDDWKGGSDPCPNFGIPKLGIYPDYYHPQEVLDRRD